MEHSLKLQITLVPMFPLIMAIIVGLSGKCLKKTSVHWLANIGVGLSTLLSIIVFYQWSKGNQSVVQETLYQWGYSGGLSFHIGFLIDKLTLVMMCVVSFVSWMVHIYTIGYMQDDPGYQRFFSYISLFTFAMLMLVMSDNFLQLFFGWEAVGLVSYLLIGFWYKRESAIFANLKAFLVNRVGDFGFLLGIAGTLYYFDSLDYLPVFKQVAKVAYQQPMLEVIPGMPWQALTVICICLFIGAMGKSAQVPLHVWLPDSMEGPTPISALIHAATMVTAGIFMVTRMSPLFEYSEAALGFVLVIGSTTCFFMGLLGIVQNDIKRIIAYSTLSQLGYMVVSLGVSAYAVGIFHLATHAFFKALLFLGAGSVIIGMHHEQNIKKMGNIRRYMPITYGTMLIGSLALIGFPGFSGFFSKDLIIEAVHHATVPGHEIAYYAVLSSVFITALYSFRLFFLVFHTKERMDLHTRDGLKESSWVVWLPLVILAIPSVIIGWIFVKDVLTDYFGTAIMVLPEHNVLQKVSFENGLHMALHGFTTLPFLLAALGVFTAYICYVMNPNIPKFIQERGYWIYQLLQNKYGFDACNEKIIVPCLRQLGWLFWRIGDRGIIDGMCVNGSAKIIHIASKIMRKFQTGYLYHYAFTMITGFLILLIWLVLSS